MPRLCATAILAAVLLPVLLAAAADPLVLPGLLRSEGLVAPATLSRPLRLLRSSGCCMQQAQMSAGMKQCAEVRTS
jgi:hypothetical protein